MNRKKTYWLVAKSLAIIFTLLFGIVLTANTILMENAAAVSTFLGVQQQQIVEDENAAEKDTQYYKSDYNSVAEVRTRGMKLIEEVVSEGTVLLKNDGALPLKSGDAVSLFSTSSVDLVTAGSGSSLSSGTLTDIVSLKDALEAPGVGLSVNSALWKWYSDNNSVYGRSNAEGVNVSYDIKDAPWSVLPDAKNNTAKAGIFVLSRKGAEGADLAVNTSLNGGNASDMTNGDYLDISPTEKTVLLGMKQLKDSGKIGKIIILMNSANQVQTHFVDDPQYGIDALLWCGTPGATGIKGVANLLVGNVNPSGRLSDTFWARHRFNPVYANYGVFTYPGLSRVYVVYQEGIYNGYRYTETRYEDAVLGQGNAGDFNYKEAVSYPFGYGLSYSEFTYSEFSVTPPAAGSDTYRVSVKVTNTGSVAGKEVVQIYLQKPYTEYDRQHGIEKASVELVGFDKTKELAAGESQTVIIEVEGKYFASYDSYHAKTWIVDEGTYYLTAAKNAHDAVNNILAQKGKSVSDGMTEEGNASLVYDRELSFDDKSYSVSTKAMENHLKSDATVITNQFDNADINLYDLMEGQSVTYVSRSDWAGTVKYGLGENNQSLGNQVRLTTNSALTDVIMERGFDPQPDDVAYPKYGVNRDPEEAGHLNLIDLRAYDDGTPIEYDNPMWDRLLDQLSWNDMTRLLATGMRLTMGITAISKPITTDGNGAIGIVWSYAANAGTNRGLAVSTMDPDRSKSPPLYPCNGMIAATFNPKLMREYGEHWGEDALWAGYSGLYGPGCNTHRSAYGGRHYEYYSEDSFLGGKACAQVVSGMMKKGLYAYLKHAILNDQELFRTTVSTYANEQTIREIYLRQFQIAIEDGGATNVMTGYNKIGAIWTGHQGFCNSVLRDEFGMTGFAVTDLIGADQHTRIPGAIMNGNDLPDQDYSSNNVFSQYATGYGKFAWAMRESVHRILFTVVHSNAMNGLSSNTRVIAITPAWITALRAIVIVTGILFGVSLLLFLLGLLRKTRLWPCRKPVAAGASEEKGTKIAESRAGSGGSRQSSHEEERSGGADGSGGKRRDRKNLVIIIESVALALLILLNSILLPIFTHLKSECGNTTKPPAGGGTTPGQVIDETQGGEGVVDHIFEAEAAEFSGVSSNGNAGKTFGNHACASASYAINEGFSGGIALRNTSTPGDYDVKNKFTFKFQSDKAVRIVMEIRISSRQTAAVMLAASHTIYVNGKEVENDVLIPNANGTDYTLNTYFYMHTVELEIKLQKGENVIEFECAPGLNQACNFDYINLKTSADLTGFVPHYWSFDGAMVIKEPTLTEGGTLAFSDGHANNTFEIPALTSDIYRKVTSEDGKDTYYLGGTDFVISGYKNEDGSGIEYLDETAGGVNVVDHIFEAEAAEYSGISSTGAAGQSYGSHACVPASYVIHEGFSGGICVRNTSTPADSDVSNKLTFRFRSDKAVRIIMDIRISSRGLNAAYLSTSHTIYVNGEEVKNSVRIPDSTDTPQIISNYFYMHTVELEIKLQEGENTIVFETAKGTSMACNLDYINLKTSANLTGFVPQYWDMSGISVTKAPTLTEGGTIYLKDSHTNHSFDLPALTSSIYTKITEGGKDIYYLGGTGIVVAEVTFSGN